ncbi:MAG: zinc ABC transporter substrate-binding protein [Clostridia bacterium]|nr:zinc ABC transporter substrate-binding protein [Clostridia bacterium]
MAERKRFLRLIARALLICLAVSFLVCLCSCAEREDDEKIKIVCTLFPQYDWLRNIIGENDSVELVLLVKNGTDIHSYQPTAADIMEISDCDMIVYLGEEVETWVGEALDRADNAEIRRIELTECDGVTLRNISAGSEGHSHEDHGHGADDGHDHGALDEHVWLSLRNAMAICRDLCDAVCELDADGADEYKSNTAEYVENLSELDREYECAVSSVPESERFMLFCDRFPFVYLLEDYGVEYSAAFEGCTTDVDADFATVLRLIEELDAHGLEYVTVGESADLSLANTVISSSKAENGRVIVMNSMQAISSRQISEGIDYLSVMRENLDALELALGVSE